MSEFEKRRRQQYKEKRKRRILYQLICIAVITVLFVACLSVFVTMNKTYYIEYDESGSVDYAVYLKDNEFYDDEYLGADHSYINVLVDKIKTQFVYDLSMNADSVEYDYVYKLDAVLNISDKNSGKTHFEKLYSIVPEKKVSETHNKISVKEDVDIDFRTYDDLARRFIAAYPSLERSATCTLFVTMHVSVIGSCEEFANNSNNEYSVTLNVPLATETFELEVGTTVPDSDPNIIACDRGIYKDAFQTSSIAFGALDVALLVALVLYIYLTRNTDINYEIKVKRLLSAYKSFIQRITNEFDKSGYQVLLVKTFDEMLEIRDTIQSPILMTENEDKTRSEFIIATNTKILYMYEVMIDDYDLIYNSTPESSPEEAVETFVALDEAPAEVEEAPTEVEEAPTEVEEAPTEVEETPTEVEEAPTEVEEAPAEVEEAPIEVEEAPAEVEETPTEVEEAPAEVEEAPTEQTATTGIGEMVGVRHRTSFMSRLIQSQPPIQDYYTAVKNALLCYKGVKARVSWGNESFNKGRLQCAKINVKGSALLVYLALDPKEYNPNKYYFTDMSSKPGVDRVPLLIKVKSERALKYTLELIEEMARKLELLKTERESVDYHMPYEDTETLVARGLIKVILPAGVILDGDESLVKVNVGKLLEDVKPQAESQIENLTPEQIHAEILEDAIIVEESADEREVLEAIFTPDYELDEIKYIDDWSEEEEHTVTNGVEIIGVVWPERPTRNKIYRYDPNGLEVKVGDHVIVPSTDVAKKREVIRKATVAHANIKIDPTSLHHPLKKIIGVVKPTANDKK